MSTETDPIFSEDFTVRIDGEVATTYIEESEEAKALHAQAYQLYMSKRLTRISIAKDMHYPRLGNEYFRRRWSWEAGERKGEAAFAISALFSALVSSRLQKPANWQINQVRKASDNHPY